MKTMEERFKKLQSDDWDEFQLGGRLLYEGL